MTTCVTVLKARLPLMTVVSPEAVLNFSLIVLPSTLVPVTVTYESSISAAVPPGVTERARGTSGSVSPDVTVVTVVAPAVAAKTAVAEAAFTSLLVSV